MRKLVVVLALGVTLGASACSVGDTTNAATGNVAVMDAAGRKACDDLRLLAQQRAGLSTSQLRDRLGQVYTDASASGNPVLRARAVTLYADATYLAEGAQPGTLNSDIAAMRRECATSRA